MARIAVIGAGMGAMAAAARLATAGHRVTVYERSATHGGAVRRFERDGFGFDTGPGLLHLPAVHRDLFVKTGKRSLEECVELTQVDPASVHLFPDGTRLALPNASRAGVVRALDAALAPGAGERWGELVNRARTAWDAIRRPLLEEPMSPDRAALLGQDPYPALPRRRLLGRKQQPRTLAEVARNELRDPRQVALLESHALAYGFDSRTAPPSSAVLAYLEHTFGTWYVRGGMRALADAVHERCRERGVAFAFGAEVVRILERDGKAAGLELADGSEAAADIVVAGVHPSAVAGLRGGSPHAGRGPQEGDGRGDRVPGRFTVCLALRGTRPAEAAHRTVVHTTDPETEAASVFGDGPREPCERPTVTVLRPDDAALRPDEAHESVTLTATVAPIGPVVWDEERAGRLADRMVEAATAAIPGLPQRVLWRRVHTPADTASETGTSDGAVPRPALVGAEGGLLLPGNTTRLPGLYLVGGWAHPGGGLAHTGMSGALVAGLIVEGDGWRGSS
ncbi:phytoene desaturase family protein [Streptomyces meridianus]|uniref:NAD(P)/FAD-dependent oxidoreductase n=1 Tax=Streptomyces meridianus TaxID=2938945 RepID=A0ABT0X2L0_9ACTN|nr:NAD(P)/FAD-dependent oxidoreductase [Streptomyces meridianus]MCM2576440.1 NAD(P)/FAD-dependent oxidoreductase [Streptomyces meridianus]